MLARLRALIHRLKPVDRNVMLLYLEGLSAAAIGEVTGLSPANVAQRSTGSRRFYSVISEREILYVGP